MNFLYGLFRPNLAQFGVSKCVRPAGCCQRGGNEIFPIHRQRINQFQPKASFGAWGSHVSTLSCKSAVSLREAKAAQEYRVPGGPVVRFPTNSLAKGKNVDRSELSNWLYSEDGFPILIGTACMLTGSKDVRRHFAYKRNRKRI